jgi:uncharacterized protein (PEP-CTERM system associated)
LPGGVNIYSQSANIYTSANANFALIGTRNTVALNIFYLKTDQLPDARVPPTFITFNNSIQQGAGISLNHRLDATKSLGASITGFETRGFGPSEGLSSTQGIAQVQVNWQVTPRNSVFTGARYQAQHSQSSSFNNSSEAAIFAGLLYAL